jgi:hypothetical protein
VLLNKYGVAAALALAAMARADVLYSDVTTFAGFGFANGGAAVVAGNDTTTMVADDITVAAGAAGATVTGFTFSVANFNGAAVPAQPIVEFFDNDGSGGGPGTLLAAFAFNPISFAAGSVQLFTFTSANLFVVPGNGTFFAGLYFDDNGGTTGASAAQLNQLGQGIYAPPTVGSSADSFFQTTGPGAVGSNPAGSFFFFGGNPTADFGWSFSGDLATPEPGTGLLLLIGGVPLAWRLRGKRRS